MRNLLAACLHRGIEKFIHVSTTDVYGHPDHPADEQAPYRLRGLPYGDTKIQGEKLVWDYHHRYGLPATVIRPAAIYGPRSTTSVSEILALLKQGKMVHIGSGEKPAGLSYAGNVVDLMLSAADADASLEQAYNVNDGSSITWRTYVNRLARMIGTPPPRIILPHRIAYGLGWAMEKSYGLLGVQQRPLLTRMAIELFATDQSFPIEKAREALGYRPRIEFEDGMKQVEHWLRQTGAL